MPRIVTALLSIVALLATAGFANTPTTLTTESGSSSTSQRTPVPAMRVPAAGNAGSTAIHWDKFYDKFGNPLPADPGDNVGPDSLYFKNYSSLTVSSMSLG